MFISCYCSPMPQIAISKGVNAPAAVVWTMLADFADVSWIPVATQVTVEGAGIGMSRAIHGSGETPVVEKLIYLDEQRMELGYSITDNPLPVSRFEALVAVRPAADDTAIVTWNVDYDPAGPTAEDDAAARQSISVVYAMMADWLADAASARGPV